METIYGGTRLVAETTSTSLWLLPALPLWGALVCGVAGPALHRRFGRRVVMVVAVGAMLATTAAALMLIARDFLPLPPQVRCLRQVLWPLFSVAGVEVTFGLTLDALSVVMLLVITVVGTLIHVYAAGYMKDEPSLARFFCYLNLFVFSMLLLVLADGFVPLLFGWEGVGVCSYLLIGFWFRRPTAAAAATKAFLVNRAGDCAFVLGICLLLWGLGGTFLPGGGVHTEQARTIVVDVPAGAAMMVHTRGERPRDARLRELRIGPTLGFRELADQLTVEYGPSGDNGRGGNAAGRPFADALAAKSVAGMPLVFAVCVLLFLGAAGKSAQVPLFAWLPDAMVGPTPVSALIHAATMVTAGVYLIARLGFLFALSPGALTVVATVGALTAFIGATAGCLQWDLKRVLAYSTVSQLGFMFVAVGSGAFAAGIFHVTTHAVFKAGLFLAAGSVIHAVNHIESGESSDPQDMRNMGGLARALPWSRLGYLTGCAAIAGFPFAAGFFSKDQIFVGLIGGGGGLPVSRGVVVAVLAATAGLTAFYMFRSYFLVFLARPPRREPTGETHEPSRRMTAVVLSLAAGSLIVGPWLGWPRNWSVDHAAPLLERFLAPVLATGAVSSATDPPSVGIEWALQAGSLLLAALGFAGARAVYHDAGRSAPWRARLSTRFSGLAAWVGGGWGFNRLYDELVVTPVRDFARATAWLDRRLFDPLVDACAASGMWLARRAAGLDKRWLDAAVDGVSQFVLFGGRGAARLQSGRIGTYLFGVALGVVVLAVLAYLLVA